jgi:hypothetical protein
MKTSEAVLEFLVPGILFVFPLLLLVLEILGLFEATAKPIPPLLTSAQFSGSAIFVAFFLCVAYLFGVLLSEIGTRLLTRGSNRVVHRCFQDHKDTLVQYGYREIRRLDFDTAPASQYWAEFSFLRAFCRVYSDDAAERIKSHESILRIFRPSLVGLPAGLVFFGGFTMLAASHWTDRRAITGAIFIVAGGITHALLRSAYLQRLYTATKSAIQHFVAVRYQSEHDGADETRIVGIQALPLGRP